MREANMRFDVIHVFPVDPEMNHLLGISAHANRTLADSAAVYPVSFA